MIWFMTIMTIMMLMKFTTIYIEDDQDWGTAENSNCINSSSIKNPLWTMMRMVKRWRWWWWRWWWWTWWWGRGWSRFRSGNCISWPSILNQAMIGGNMVRICTDHDAESCIVDYDDSDDEKDDEDWGTAENSNCISSPLSKKRKPHLLVSAAGGRNQDQNCSLQRKYKILGMKMWKSQKLDTNDVKSLKQKLCRSF